MLSCHKKIQRNEESHDNNKRKELKSRSEQSKGEMIIEDKIKWQYEEKRDDNRKEGKGRQKTLTNITTWQRKA